MLEFIYHKRNPLITTVVDGRKTLHEDIITRVLQ